MSNQLAFIQAPRGSKAPLRGWNQPYSIEYPNGFKMLDALPADTAYNTGLYHAASGTLALDIDDLGQAKPILKQAGIDLDQLLSSEHMVQVKSPKPNRAKLLFKLPEGEKGKLRQYAGKTGMVFECRAGNCQDIIAGQHPDGGSYELLGDINNLPTTPPELINLLRNWDSIAKTDHRVSNVFQIAKTLDTPLQNDFKPTKDNAQMLVDAVEAGVNRGIDLSTEQNWVKLLFEFRSLVFLCNWPEGKTYRLFDEICQRYTGYDEIKNRQRWDANDFKPDGITYKSLLFELKQQKEVPAVQSPAKEYKLLTPSDLINKKPTEWLIKGILPQNGIGSLFGPSGSGKSFLVLDMAFNICRGVSWFGYKIKQAQPVVYLALEGGAGIAQRLLAYTKHHDVELNNFFIIMQPFDIRRNVPALLDSITAVKPTLVIIDTLAQSAPGLNENENADMSQLLAGGKAIADATGGLTLFVHHTGKDLNRGQRGHSSLQGALDVAIEVCPPTKEKPRHWRINKQKDGDSSLSAEFSLLTVNLGLDQDGDFITSCVIDRNTSAVFAPAMPRGKNQTTAYLHIKAHSPIDRIQAVADLQGEFGRKSRAIEALDSLLADGFVEEIGGLLHDRFRPETTETVKTGN